jgi:tRNA A-37 threonylcarbamoyl transferase component Bud32
VKKTLKRPAVPADEGLVGETGEPTAIDDTMVAAEPTPVRPSPAVPAGPSPQRSTMVRRCPECSGEWDGDTGPDNCPTHNTPLLSVEREDALVGRVIDNRWEVKHLLGQGGMGVVYCAFQRAVNRDVAIKFLRRAYADDFVAVKRFLKEARAASGLTHPNTITVFDSGQTRDGLLYFTMELLEGQSLLNILRRERHLNPVRALRIAMQIADSLTEAHEKGIIHRDLKPENIQLEQRHGHADFVKVLDFGIARTITEERERRLTRSGMVCGTAAYMSPEGAQARSTDERSDIYSLGVMLFEMLSGGLPFEGESTMEMMMAHVSERAPRLRDAGIAVPRALDAVVWRMMAKEPDQRHDAVKTVRAELNAILIQLERADGAGFGGDTANDRAAATQGNVIPRTSELEIPVALLATDEQPAQGPTARAIPWLAAFVVVLGALVAFLLLKDRSQAGTPVVAAATPRPAMVADPGPERGPDPVAPSGPGRQAIKAVPIAAEHEAAVPTPRRASDHAEEAVERHPIDGPAAVLIRSADGEIAEVWEDRKRLGTTPFEALLIGGDTRKLVLKRKGFFPAELDVGAVQGEELVVAMTPKPRRPTQGRARTLKRGM